MKLKRVSASNFGSYSQIEFDFESQGLSIIQGPTGAGKSTLFDLPLWVLYGITAKNGTVDEVKNWNSEEPTSATLEIDDIIVTRIRGKANENDLYWTEKSIPEDKRRGKDLQDTQKALTERLACSGDVYCAATYFNEFSPQNSFFLGTPKQKREFLENIVDFELAVKLQDRASKQITDINKQRVKLQQQLFFIDGKTETLSQQIVDANIQRDNWENTYQLFMHGLQVKSDNFRLEKSSKIAALETKSSQFEKTRLTKIATISDHAAKLKGVIFEGPLANLHSCPTCKQKIHAAERAKLDSLLDLIQLTKTEVNPFTKQIDEAKQLKNHHFDRINEESQTKNPYDILIHNLQDKQKQNTAVGQNSSKQLAALDKKLNDLSFIQALALELRGVLLENATIEVQTTANTVLEKHFDTMFRIDLKISKKDNLDVSILRNGSECSYTQLSKGQRGLLKLAFSLGLMKMVSNRRGVQANTLFFDEALDGLDADLKVKAFGLFEELSKDYENILVIDHSPELKQMFSNVYTAELINDNTELVKQS